MPLSPGPQEMQPWQPVVLLALLLVTLASSAPLAIAAVSRNLGTLELLLSHTSKQQEDQQEQEKQQEEEENQEQEEEEIVREKRGPRCLLHCLALGRLHPAQCHQLC